VANNFSDMAYSLLVGSLKDPNQAFAQSIAPFGLRYADATTGQQPFEAKGLGYFGQIPTQDGSTMTEYSTSFDINGKNVSAPLVVPTLTPDELNILTSGQQPTEGIYQKAYNYAKDRINQGLDPFATGNDMRMPMPNFMPPSE
jgi:hypothetical protein